MARRKSLSEGSSDTHASRFAESQRQTLLSQIQSDETISDVTRGELLAGLEVGVLESGLDNPFKRRSALESRIGASRSLFSTARAGVEDKFRSRQAFQRKKNLIKDRPGQRQLRGTLLSRANPLSTEGKDGPKKKKSLLTEDLGIASPLGK